MQVGRSQPGFRRAPGRWRRSTTLARARSIVILPVATVGAEAPGLIAGGQTVLLVEHLAFAASTAVALALLYRVVTRILDG